MGTLLNLPKGFQWVILAVVLGAGTSVGVYYYHRHVAAVDKAKADAAANHADQNAALQNQDHQQTVADDAKVKPLQDRIATLEAELAALKNKPRPAVTPPPAPPAPEPLPAIPVTPPLEQKQDELIQALQDQHTLDVTRITDRDKELVTANAQIADLRTEVGQLRASLAATPRERPWGIGAVYGSNGTQGGTVVRSFGPLEVGADVVQQSIGNGQRSIQIVGRLLWRF